RFLVHGFFLGKDTLLVFLQFCPALASLSFHFIFCFQRFLLRFQQSFPFLSFGCLQGFVYNVSCLFLCCAHFFRILTDLVFHSNFSGNRNRNKQRDYYSNDCNKNIQYCTHYRSTSLFNFHCTISTTLQFYNVSTTLSIRL